MRILTLGKQGPDCLLQSGMCTGRGVPDTQVWVARAVPFLFCAAGCGAGCA